MYIQSLTNLFINGCKDGNLNDVREALSKGVDIQIHNNNGLRLASKNGHIEVVKYLLESNELINHACPDAANNHALFAACVNNHYDVIEYLLSPKFNLDISNNDDDLILRMCRFGNLDMIKFLLTSNKINKHPDICAQNYEAIFTLINNRKTDALQWLILEYNMNIPENVIEGIRDFKTELTHEFLNLINNKKLNEKLNNIAPVQKNSDFCSKI